LLVRKLYSNNARSAIVWLETIINFNFASRVDRSRAAIIANAPEPRAELADDTKWASES